MLLVADSGSTKADWLLFDGDKITGPIHTMGFNPFFHSSEFVLESLMKSEEMKNIRDQITNVKFFGAGCSSDDRNEIIALGLRNFFTKADVLVEHDLLACAIATCGNTKGIACIIGTGSNSCYFDGAEVHERNYGLGYILGDEGSGSYFGKKLLTYYLYERLPSDLQKDFKETYHLSKNDIIDKVYKEPNPNVWLASFSRFLSKHQEHPYIKEMILQGMRDFCNLYVCDFPTYKTEKVHFVGSVAFIFSAELHQVADELGFTIGKIIKQPIDDLMQYFVALEKQR
jgi:N-acetylglucosamine kinase-like BadF-type ATPase